MTAPTASATDGDEGPPSPWSRLKARLAQGTRGGRRSAAQAQIDARRQRQLQIDPAPFPVRPIELADMLDPKSPDALRNLGGTRGLCRALGVDPSYGLDLAFEADTNDIEQRAPTEGIQAEDGFVRATMADRLRVYGKNHLIPRPSKSLWLLMLLALQDRTLILLSAAAIISLALGLYTDFGADPEILPCQNPVPGLGGCPAPDVDWVEGVAIVIAIAVVVLVGSLNDWQKEKKFQQLDAEKDRRDVKVLRQGSPRIIPIEQVVVGDILFIEPGEIVACDAVFLRGHNVRCDESGATGESDMVRKAALEDCWDEHVASKAEGRHMRRDCFLISGSKVLEGVGEGIVIAVGEQSFNGKLLMSLRAENEETPLQKKLNGLAQQIALFGSIAGGLLFFVLMIRFFVKLGTDPDRTSDEKGQDFIQILILAVTLIVVAVPEGLPLAVTLALAFATKRMFQKHLLVRVLSACETMANANVVCTDKTGTLTQNRMRVVVAQVAGVQAAVPGRGVEGTPPLAQLNTLPSELISLVNDSIAINSTAFEEEETVHTTEKKNIKTKVMTTGWFDKLFHWLMPTVPSLADADVEEETSSFSGSKTETALLALASSLSWEDYRLSRDKYTVVQVVPFASERKAMAVVVQLPNRGYRLLIKGASEMLLQCSTRSVSSDGEFDLSDEQRAGLDATITQWAGKSLRTIALCYRDFGSWPPPSAPLNDAGDEVEYRWLAANLTFLGMMGIEDPLRPGVAEAVRTCQRAGVDIKMCTGDNVLTAQSIAEQCGILTADGLVMEGPAFRRLSPPALRDVVPRLRVLARSSPQDKQLLVDTLKTLGNIVGVTGDGTNDGPALKSAHIGFSMGVTGTEVAKEASDIILLTDNFASILDAIMWGRCVNDAVRKFIMFQVHACASACIITFFSSVVNNKSNLTAVQLLYCNLCLDVLAALALATDPATPELLNRTPARASDPLISCQMWLVIVSQSAYESIVALVLSFAGERILGLQDHGDPLLESQDDTLISTLVFNAFLWSLIFNQFNARRLDRNLNVWGGMLANPWFVGIVLLETGLQVCIIYVGGAAFSVRRLEGKYWAISIVIGFLTIPLNMLVKFWWATHNPSCFHRRKRERQDEKWESPAMGAVAQQLKFFENMRGPRVATQLNSAPPSRINTQASLPVSMLPAQVPGFGHVPPACAKWHIFGSDKEHTTDHAQTVMVLAPALTSVAPMWVSVGAGPEPVVVPTLQTTDLEHTTATMTAGPTSPLSDAPSYTSVSLQDDHRANE